MNEPLTWILAGALTVGVVVFLLWLGRRRQQRARDAAAHREAQRVALAQAEHAARAQRVATDLERQATGTPADAAHARDVQAGVAERLAEQRAVEAAREADRVRAERDAAAQQAAHAEAARLAAAEAQARRLADERAALERAEAERLAREEAEAEAAREVEERAEAERIEAERLEAERQAREAAARVEREAAEAEARRQAEARERAERERAEQEQAAREEAERQAREQAEREAQAAAEAARRAAVARAEADRLEAERLEAERQRAERERVEREQAEREQAERRAAEEAAAAAAAQATRELRPDETLVLVADDSKIVRVKISRLLAGQGYRVALADSGEQALELLAAERPHVLITDVEMPGIDGFELTRQVRAAAATAGLPVLMITSSDDKQDEARAAGVTQLLGKPYSEEALIGAIEHARLAVRVPA